MCVEKEKLIDIKKITISFDETYHLYNNQPLYNRKFKKVMSFHAPGIAAVEDDEGAYHINILGKPIYFHKFIKTFGFYDGVATVADGTGYFHIDIKGNPIYTNRFKWAGNFQEGRCVVLDENGSYFHIKIDGTAAYKEKYRYAGDYKYGIAVVYTEDGFAKHINKNGNDIHEKKQIELGVFHKGFAIARDERGYFHINKKGMPLYSQRYEWVEPFYNEFALVRKYDGYLCIINESGQEIRKIIGIDSEYIKNRERQKLMGKLIGYWNTQIIYSIVKLQILDLIKEGVNTFEQLSKKLQIPVESLELILKFLKVYNFIHEVNGKFILKYLGEILTEKHPKSLKYASLMWGDEHYTAMSSLIDALRTYKPQFEKIFGVPFFDYCIKNKEKGEIYNKAMKEYNFDYDEIISLYDFSNTSRLLDVGGGAGGLLSKILSKFENIKEGILFDLPSVIKSAEREIQNLPISHKIKVESGDFFKRIGVTADTILLSRVIHDWDDKSAIKILKNVKNVLDDDGRLLIFETIVPESANYDLGISLNFSLLVIVGGKERTLNEFKTLLAKSELKLS